MSVYECNQCKNIFEQDESCGCACSSEAVECPKCASTDVSHLDEAARMRKLFGNMKPSRG